MTGDRRCPYCGCPAIPDVPTHIAFTIDCMSEQITSVVFIPIEEEHDEGR